MGAFGAIDVKTSVVLQHRTLLIVAGPDRAAFLQGLISNDIAKGTTERAIYASLLTAQGRFLHDFFIAAVGGASWLDGEAARRADLQRRPTTDQLPSKGP